MATNGRSPSFVLLLLVGAFLLTSATLGHAWPWVWSSKTEAPLTDDDDNSSPSYDDLSNDNDISTNIGDSDSEDLNAQPAVYGLQSQDAASPRCSRSCSNAHKKFNYEIGTTYQYTYEGDLRTYVTKTEFTGVKVTAEADIEVVSACEFVLKLSQVTLRDYDPENGNRLEAPPSAYQFKNSLEAHPLSFSFDDGTIDAICPSSDEEPWVLNIKRAILSQFQNTMPSRKGSTTVRETDVSGTCETAYSSGSGRITRIKDLNKCKGRHMGQTALQGVQYKTKMGLQSVPILKATQECRQEIDNSRQIIRNAECTEQFSFAPLEDKVSGASTTVTTKLVYQSSVRQDQATDFTRINQVRSTLVFDHRFGAHEVAESYREALDTLRTLQLESDVTHNTPQLFNKLTKQMKKLDAEKLQSLLGTARTDRAKSFVYDALPLLETAASLKVIREIFFGNVNSRHRDMWISSLAFIQEPTKEMLDEAKHFLDLDFEKSALSVSTLAHNYLKSDSPGDHSRDVEPIIAALFQKLRPKCEATGEQEEYLTLKVLKAIGNIGRSRDAASGLMECAMNKDASMVIRVAAVDAFRRQDCLPGNLQFLDQTLADIELDSELRITAYLQRAKCFDRDFFFSIKDVLEKEKINQVGSFIWSHLTNLAESGSPLKSDIAKMLRDVKSFRQFDMDERKFSRNDEWSYFDDTGNYGATAESNLIWSQSSFMPRSASLNLTVDLFGQSINLLEFGTRVQGVEAILEKIFRDKASQAASASPNGEDAFDSTFTKKADETRLGFYMRVFGNELVTEQLNPGTVDIMEMIGRVNYMDFLTMLAQERQMEFTRSYKIIDASLCLPTQVGLPLKLSVEGTATVTLNARGKFDILRMMSSSPSLDIGGQFKPSSAVVISGEMGVDFRHVKQGIRVVSTVHSKAVFDGKIQFKNGNEFNFDINMPEERIDLFSMESKFYVVNRGERTEKINQHVRTMAEIECLEDGFVPILGVKPCLDYSYPDIESLREFDVTSFTPLSLRFYIAKTDTHTGYHLSSSFVRSAADPTDVFTFELDTPNSRVNRKISTNFQLHRSAQRITAELRSPWKVLALDTSLMIAQNLWKVDSSLVVDERYTYRANAEMKAEVTGDLVHYTFKSGLQKPESPITTLDGHLKYNDHRIESRANLTNVLARPLVVSFGFDHLKNVNKYQVTAGLNSQPLIFAVKSTVSNLQPNSMTMMVKTDVNYKFGGGQKQTIATELKIKDKSTRNLKSFDSSGHVTLSEFPYMNLNGVYNLEYSATSLRQKFELGQDEQNKIIIDQSGILDLYQGPGQRFQGSLQVQVPIQNINYKANFDYKRSESELSIDTYLSSHEQKMASGILNVKSSARAPVDMAIKTELSALGYGLKIETTLKETALMTYSALAKGDLQSPRFRKSIEAEADYKIVDGSRHEWHLKAALEGFNPIEFSGHVNPNLKNLQVKGAVVYSGDTYSAGFDYLHRGTSDTNFNCKFDVKVDYPGAEHQLEIKMTRRDMEFGAEGRLQLKTSRTNSRDHQILEYKLSGQVAVHPYTPAFLLRIEWPQDDFIQLSAGGKYESGGWLSTAEDLKGEIAFKSSIRGAEEFLINFQLDLDQELTTSAATLTWAPNRKITADFSMDSSKIQLNFTTPFEHYRSIRFQTLTTLQGTQARPFSHTTRLIWDSKFVTFAINCNTTRLANFNGKATISTAFEGFESISLALKNRLKGGDYHGSAELNLPRNQKMMLLLDSKNAITRGQATSEGRIAYSTQRSEINQFSWNHKHNSTTINSLLELVVFDQKYSAHLTGLSKLTKTYVINGKLDIKTPHEGLTNFGAEFEHSHNTSGVQTSQRLSMNLEQQFIVLSHQLQYSPRSILIYNIKATTSFRYFENLEFLLNNRIEGPTTTSKVITDLGPFSRNILIILSGSFENKQNGEFSGTYELTTSSESVQRATLDFGNDRVDGKWKTSCNVKVNDVAIVSAASRLVYIGREKVFELDLSTPLEGLKSVKFTIDSVGTNKNQTISTSLEHNLLTDRIGFSLSYDVRDLKKLLFFARLTTPFRAYERIALRASKLGTWEKFNSGLDIEINDKRLESTTAFEVGPNNLIKLTKNLELPFEAIYFLKSASFEMQHTGSLSDFVNTVSVRVTDHGGLPSSLSSEFKAEGPSGKITITTPRDSLRSLIMQFNHQSKNTRYGIGWTNEASLELYGQPPLTFKSEYSKPDIDEIKAMVAFHLPKEHSINFRMKGELDDLKTELNFTMDHTIVNNAVTFKMPGQNEFELKYKMNTGAIPKPFEASLIHRGPRDNFRTEFRMTNLWLDDSEEIVLKLVHSGQWTEFNTELTAEAGLSHYRDALKFHFGGPGDITLVATVETPHTGYERFGLDFKHSGVMQDFSSELKVTSSIRNYERASLVLVHRGQPLEIRSSLKLTTSHPSFPSAEVTLDHKASEFVLSNVLKIVLPGDNTIESNFAVTFASADNYEGTWIVKTPFQGYDRFSMVLKKEKVVINGVSTEKTWAEIKTPFRDYREIKQETVNIIENGGKTMRSRRVFTVVPQGTLEENTYLNFEDMPTSVEYYYTLNSSIPQYNGYHVATNYSIGATKKLSALLETPFEALRRFSLKMQSEDIASSLNLDYNREYTVDIQLKHRGDTKLTCDVKTPIRGFSSLTLGAEQTGSFDNFRTNLYFQMPDSELKEIVMSLHHKGQPSKFKTSLNVDLVTNAETKTMKSELNVRLENMANYQLIFSLETPFSCVRNLLFRHGIDFSTYNHIAFVDVTFNDEKKFDVEYKNPMDGGSFSFLMRSPYQMGSSVSLAGTSGSADINWDTTKPDKNVRFEFGLLTSVSPSRSSNGVNFTVITAGYRAGFGIDLTIDESSLSHGLGMHWQRGSDKGDYSYEIKGSKRRERSGEQTEGSLRIATGSSLDVVIGFSDLVGERMSLAKIYKEDKMANTQVSLTHKIDLAYNAFTHTLTFEHPRFPKDIVLTTDVSADRSLISLKQALQLNNDIYNLEATIKDDDSDGRNKVIATIRAYHNPSALDLTVTGEWEDTKTETILIGSVSYKLINARDPKKMTIQSVYNEEKEEIKIDLTTPVTSLTLRTENRQTDMDEGILGYDIILESPEFFHFKTALDFSLPERMVDFRFYTSEEVYFQVLGEMKKFSEASITLSRYDDETPEGDKSVNLGWSINDKSFLVGRCHVRPNLLEDWMRRMQLGARDSEATFRRIAGSYMELKQLLDEDAALKAAKMRESVQPYGPAFREMKEAVEDIMEGVEKMYDSNFLFIKDIVRGLRMLFEALGNQLRVCMAKTAAALQDYCQRVKQRMAELNQKMAHLWRLFVAQLESLKPHFDVVRQKIEGYCRDFEVKLRAFLEDILTEEVIAQIIEMLRNLENLNLEQFRMLVVEWLNAFFNDINIRKIIENFAWNLEQYQDILSMFVTRERITELVRGIRALAADSHISAKFVEAAEHFFKISENRWTVWDPRTGNYEFQVYLPPSIPALGDILIETDLDELFDSIETLSDELSEMIEEFTNFAELLHSSELTKEKFIELFPPFKAYASISGSQHYRTFDGRVFQFAGDCTYLLARDFLGKTFTVFVTYKKDLRNGLPVKKSIGITTDDRTFEIYPDGRVAVDGTKTELPFSFMNTTILRTGGNEVQLVNGHGFKLVCDVAHDHCGLTVSGWYHGKLAGLFGINDFEPENDMMSSSNVKMSVTEELASSWALGSRCENENTAVVNQYNPSSKPYQICEALFGISSYSSPLRPCFKTISPLDYRQMCLNDMPRPGENHIVNDKTPCNVAAAYVKDCRAQDVLVKMPKQCVQCGDIRARPGHFEGDTFQMTVESQNRVADVVFVMQSGQCNKKAFEKLRNLAEQLQKAFVESEGISSIKYALVGYGGSYGSPRIHTLDSQAFNTFDKLNRVNFDTTSASESMIDGLNAIHFATKLPFRTGASKTIVFVPCNLCLEDGKSGLRFSDLHRTLIQSDIRLHVLLPELFKLASSSPATTKSAFIYGMDDQKAYTRRDVTGNELEGDASLRHFVRLPKDYCAALTHNTDGSVFSSKQWLETPVNIQKSFIDIFTRLVAKRAQPAVSQQCTCHADSVGVGVSQCSNSVRRSLGFWNLANFEDDEDVPAIPQRPPRPVRPDSQGPQVTRQPQRGQHQSPRPRPTRPTRRPQQA